ncbi:MAG: hypothetical protein RSE41_00400 [Clostridia bacterium]
MARRQIEYITIELNDSVVLRLTEVQLKFLCIISVDTPDHNNIISLLKRQVNEDILKSISNIIKIRQLYNTLCGFQYNEEKNIMQQLNIVSKTIDCVLSN